jgi:hypothetical protein
VLLSPRVLFSCRGGKHDWVDGDGLSDGQTDDSGAQGDNSTDRFMTHHLARVSSTVLTCETVNVGTTNPRGHHTNDGLVVTRHGIWSIAHDELAKLLKYESTHENAFRVKVWDCSMNSGYRVSDNYTQPN